MIPFSVHEEHGEVVATWQALGLKRATVVCFDRHLDLKALAPRGIAQLDRAAADGGDLTRLNRPIPFQEDRRYAYGLDNFVLAAVRLGLLQRFVWVHPEPVPLADDRLAAMLWDRLSLVAGHGREILRTFRICPEAVTAEVDGATIQITTPNRLAGLDLPRDVHLDFDFDFFATEQGRLLHEPDHIVDLLNRLKLTDRDPTLTWSITSGFLPESFEWVGTRFADRLGRALGPRLRPSLAPCAMQLLSAAPASQPDELRRVISEELEPIGGAGLSLAAVLALHTDPGNRDSAIGYWHRAQENGDGASWPAYSIGLSFMEEGDYRNAEPWFARGAGDQVDTIQLHGTCMRAICLARMARWEEALGLALNLTRRVPMRREPWTIARSAAKALDRPRLEQMILRQTPRLPFPGKP